MPVFLKVTGSFLKKSKGTFYLEQKSTPDFQKVTSALNCPLHSKVKTTELFKYFMCQQVWRFLPLALG